LVSGAAPQFPEFDLGTEDTRVLSGATGRTVEHDVAVFSRERMIEKLAAEETKRIKQGWLSTTTNRHHIERCRSASCARCADATVSSGPACGRDRTRVTTEEIRKFQAIYEAVHGTPLVFEEAAEMATSLIALYATIHGIVEPYDERRKEDRKNNSLRAEVE
jgi:hypothetical protein